MYTKQTKKLVILNILEILRRYSDEKHRLSTQEIVSLLKGEYDMTVDRKTVKRNLMDLIDSGYHIEYTEISRSGKNGEDADIQTDWYLEHEISDSELRLLIDSLLFSKHIPYSQCRALVEKLEGQSSQYFRSRVKYIRTLPNDGTVNSQLFYTIDVLDEAIESKKKVAFRYREYGVDKKLHNRKDREGNDQIYVVNPYQMAASHGRYYLIGNYDKYDNVTHYRLDRITDISILEEKRKPETNVQGLEQGLKLSSHMAEHIYMFSGDRATVRFRAKQHIIGEVIDWFGKDVNISDVTEDEMTVTVEVNENAMFYWLLQYGMFVRVLSPEKLKDRVTGAIRQMERNYGINGGEKR